MVASGSAQIQGPGVLCLGLIQPTGIAEEDGNPGGGLAVILVVTELLERVAGFSQVDKGGILMRLAGLVEQTSRIEARQREFLLVGVVEDVEAPMGLRCVFVTVPVVGDAELVVCMVDQLHVLQPLCKGEGVVEVIQRLAHGFSVFSDRESGLEASPLDEQQTEVGFLVPRFGVDAVGQHVDALEQLAIIPHGTRFGDGHVHLGLAGQAGIQKRIGQFDALLLVRQLGGQLEERFHPFGHGHGRIEGDRPQFGKGPAILGANPRAEGDEAGQQTRGQRRETGGSHHGQSRKYALGFAFAMTEVMQGLFPSKFPLHLRSLLGKKPTL